MVKTKIKAKTAKKEETAEESYIKSSERTCPACGSSSVVCNRQDDSLVCRDCGTIFPTGCGEEDLE